jgi:hypothetical protein
MSRLFIVAVAVMTCWSCSTVAERADVEIGVLTCTLGEPTPVPPSTTLSTQRTRDALCTFTPRTGAHEIYAGKVEGVSISQDQRGALIWVVKQATGAAVEPGLLQQSYASDRNTPADQEPPLTGEINSAIALYSMADKSEGSAGTKGKVALRGYVIINLELTLKNSLA